MLVVSHVLPGSTLCAGYRMKADITIFADMSLIAVIAQYDSVYRVIVRVWKPRRTPEAPNDVLLNGSHGSGDHRSKAAVQSFLVIPTTLIESWQTPNNTQDAIYQLYDCRHFTLSFIRSHGNQNVRLASHYVRTALGGTCVCQTLPHTLYSRMLGSFFDIG